jgi:hypothetical protein
MKICSNENVTCYKVIDPFELYAFYINFIFIRIHIVKVTIL